jgi:hypothetical protein
LNDYFGPLVAKHSRRGWTTRLTTLELVWEEDRKKSTSLEAAWGERLATLFDGK